jgi:predicted ThiF/HesA family dinucleotide-utilizing enzyme
LIGSYAADLMFKFCTSKTTENVETIREFIHEDRRRTIHELADTAGISYGVCQEIVTENFNMRGIAA